MARLHLLEEIDALAFAERHVRLLPIGAAAEALADPAHLAEDVRCPDLQHLHLEQALDGALDLELVGVRTHLEHHLVPGLVHERPLLGDERGRDDVVLALHAATRALIAASASRVTTRWW